MKKTLLFAMISGLFLLSFPSCSTDDAEELPEVEKDVVKDTVANSVSKDTVATFKERRDIVLRDKDKTINNLLNAFAWKLYKASAEAENKNLLVSPLSMEAMLLMSSNGVAGSTWSEIACALGVEGVSLSDCNEYASSVYSQLANADNYATFTLANALWVQNGMTINSQYEEAVKQNFGAECSAIDFGASDAAAKINDWCNLKTSGMIPAIVDNSMLEDIDMLLANVINFNATWMETFDKEKTEKDMFFCADGTKSEVSMMKQSTYYDYAKTDKAQIVQLPYGNSAMSMYIIMPDEDVFISDYESELTVATILEAEKAMQSTEVHLSLPSFSVDNRLAMRRVLESMGVKSLFGTNADFSPMTSANVRVPGMVQCATISVTEQGTKAAAASFWGFSTYDPNAPKPEPVVLSINRPFIFYIKECSTGKNIFIGRVSKL